jgi:hypothetical protein
VEKLDIGRMVWLKQVVDPQGDLKGEHAAVVLTTKAELQAGQPILAVVFSSKFEGLREDQIVRLKHQAKKGGHPLTHINTKAL